MSKPEFRYTVEFGCSRGYWIKCFETENECFEEMSFPNQQFFKWVDYESYDQAIKERDESQALLDHAEVYLSRVLEIRELRQGEIVNPDLLGEIYDGEKTEVLLEKIKRFKAEGSGE